MRFELMQIVAMLRLVFLLLFFILTQIACNNGAQLIGCLDPEREALIDFKNGLQDPENRLSSWKGTNCCRWWGISCDNTTGAVIAVDLQNPHPLHPFEDSASSGRYGLWNLSGEIRPSLKLLKSLKHLDLSFNTFNGISIPKFFGSLKNLQYPNLSNAGFSGAIPTSLGNLSSLQYLDFASNIIYGDNLEWATGVASLEYLNMNKVDLSMVGSNWIQKLNKLSSLTELHLSNCQLAGFIPSISMINFTSLAVIELDRNSFSSEIPTWIVNMSNLVTVSISDCGLYGRIPLGFGELPGLKLLDLSLNNNLTASCSQLFGQRWPKLEVIALASNKLHSKLPFSIGNITTLTYFDLLANKVEGWIPSSIGRLCNLNFFRLMGNDLTGTLPEVLLTDYCTSRTPLPKLQFLQLANNQLVGKLPEWLGQLETLVELSLSGNSLYGPIPDSLGSLSNISELSLGYNKLNGTIPDSLGKLSQLSVFDVSFNQLTSIVTETHFSELSKLKFLLLSSNSLVLNVSSNWMPPFQIRNLDLGSCHLGSSFPSWLRSQKEVQYLDFSESSISGSIPHWFWEVSSNLSLLNISFNQLEGQLPNPLNIAPDADIDFRSNLFQGPLPLPVVNVELLDLSNNAFSGPIPNNIGEITPSLIFMSLSGNQLMGEIPASIGKMLDLGAIDLSNNILNGSILPGIGNFSFLKVLDFSKNNLSGSIPNSLGQLKPLQTLHLSDNKLSGEFPKALQNLSSLETLDLGNNSLTGTIPLWIGERFGNLKILRLRSNAFSGELPSLLSSLSSLQVLDLGENQLNGSIPSSFGDFKAMSQVQNTKSYRFYGVYRGIYYEESLVLNWKGSSQKFNRSLSLINSIDVSGNQLSGDLPEEITELSGLVVLNISRNHIRGHIPVSIFKLQQLQSLDLSNNRLSGPVPQSLSSLSFLGYLNMSNYDFSGMIPYTGHTTTFEASSFAGNPGLCGAPLAVRCPSTAPEKTPGGGDDDDDNFIDKWFYLSVGLGFAAGILVPFFILATKKSWSYAYFCFIDEVLERISCLKN